MIHEDHYGFQSILTIFPDDFQSFSLSLRYRLFRINIFLLKPTQFFTDCITNDIAQEIVTATYEELKVK